MSRNLLAVPGEGVFTDASGPEFFETLARGRGVRIERILSHGQATPENEWYDQDQDEWVAVIEGEAAIAWRDGTEVFLRKGDHLLLPRRVPHRVTYTSSPCVWLAVFADALEAAREEAE